MTAQYQDIHVKAMALSHAERDLLAQELLDSLDDIDASEQAEIEKAWGDEAQRRLADYRAGRTKAIPVEEALDNVRKEMGWPK